MEQSKSTLDTIKKQHFWILLAVVFVLGVVIAVLAKSAVMKQFADRKTALEGLQSSMQTLSSDSAHPNEETIESLEGIVYIEKDDVFKVWEEMRAQQQEKLEWPEDLGPDFHDAIDGKTRAEVIQVLRDDFELREIYLGFIQEHFPTMLELVERRHREQAIEDEDGVLGEWEDSPEPALDAAAAAPPPLPSFGGGGMGMGMGEESGGEYGAFSGEYGSGTGSEYGGEMSGEYGSEMGGDFGGGMSGSMMSGGLPPGITPAGVITIKTRFNGKVSWRLPEIYRITSEPEGGRWERIPYAEQIWLAQEDLWVYETLLRVITDTNTRAQSHFDAPIQEIIQLDIGRYAAAKISEPTYGVLGGGLSASSMLDMESEMGMGEEDMGMGEDGSMMGIASTGNPEEDKKNLLMDYRYVDAAGVPLGTDDPPPFVEFNMMPVHMVLKIDQLAVPEFLVNCANSSMPIDVRIVRLAPNQARPFPIASFQQSTLGMEGEEGMGEMSMGGMSGMSGGMSDYGESEYGSGGEYGSEGYGEEMGGYGGQNNAIRELDPYGESHMIVEIQGVIYIYNEPDFDLVGTGAGVQEDGEEADPDATPVDDTGVPVAGASASENVVVSGSLIN